MATKPLAGRVALVTGATRGIGKGIAIELAAAGALVYITGRTMTAKEGKVGSLEQTAEAIRNRGGQCISVRVDHEKSDEVEALFERIAKEQDGRLDILVNNAFKAGTYNVERFGKSFWEIEPQSFDETNDVALRNHYYCAVYAARLMVPRKQGLMVTVSSPGGLMYWGFVAYGIGKAACDRMAADTAIELKKYNVASISLWPGLVHTELIDSIDPNTEPGKLLKNFGKGESQEFVGRVVTHLAQNPSLMKYTGKIIITADYASAHGIVDTDGQYPNSIRSLSTFIQNIPGLSWLSSWVPGFIKLPYWLIHQLGNKF